MTFDVNMVIYLLGLACTAGVMVGKITSLEKKVDKHNCLIERMYVVEERGKSNTHRIDEIEEDFKNAKKAI